MTTTPRKRNVKSTVDLFARGSRAPERVVPLCLDGGLQVALDAAKDVLMQAVAELKQAAGASATMGEDEDVAVARTAANTAQAALDDIVEEMKGCVVEFRMRGLVGDESEDILTEHPPRDEVDLDQKAGYNVKAVQFAYAVAGCVEPKKTLTQWENFWATLTPYQRRQLSGAVDELTHAEGTSVPFL